MKPNNCFDECKDCMYKDHSDDLMCCVVSKLGLAFHKLFVETPIVNKFVDKYKYCNWFIEEKE